MKRGIIFGLAVVAMGIMLGLSAQSASADAITVLYSFNPGTDWTGPGYPQGSLVKSGTSLYGTTSSGGTNSSGTVFKFDLGGSLTTLHSLAPRDTESPNTGSLVQGGSTLFYGLEQTLASGGSSVGAGNIFSIGSTPGTFSVVRALATDNSEGCAVRGSLIWSGAGGTLGTLYGMAPYGGALGSIAGTVFKFNLDAGVLTKLHDFTSATEGQHPMGDLVLYGDYLYGMTGYGGGTTTDNGTIFKMKTDGSGFAVLHTFVGGSADGAKPQGSLTLSADGNTLYGMTSQGGGADNNGIVFSIPTSGGALSILHDFTGGTDGGSPQGSLVLSGTTLYGMAMLGGAGSGLGNGTIFSVGATGSGFEVIHQFAGGALDGATPQGSLLLDGNTLYGMTSGGGANSAGTIFSVQLVPEPATMAFLALGGLAMAGRAIRRRIVRR
ncbi:MAG: PEP-CTERM sorting domain-containing protein [Phycisphaerae bacterium]|nr:PEP-CTERM sorting domain-containing protein [Phycisphaerae bacterium]